MQTSTAARLRSRSVLVLLVVVAWSGIVLAAASSAAQGDSELLLPGPLSTAHATLEKTGSCDACHEPGEGVTAKRCLACHDSISARMASKRGVHRDVTGDCAMCHEEHAGRDADIRPLDVDDFDHVEETGFPLNGMHARLATDCANCHTTRSFLALTPECSSCHEDPHGTALGADCASCHNVFASFRNASRAFHKDSLLPLEGRHVAVPCAECHWNGQIEGTPTRCYDCHWIRRQDDRFRTALGAECEQCHRPISWTAVSWDHAAATGQELGTAHFGVDCDACHSSGVFDRSVPTDCVSCHINDYNSTNDPDHAQAGFPTDCEICHSPSAPSWEGATFAHSIYPLVGSHTSLDCNACHSSGVYQGLPSECVDCHIDDFNATTNPNHQTAGFPTDCEVCHSSSSPTWEGATFAHSIYPLVGSHTSLDCNACHSSGVYQGLPSECVDCHIDDFNATTNPNHQTAGFPTDCEVCHSGSSPTWEGATFAHSIYPLVGSHTSLDCNACHSSGVYQGLPSECVDCHIDDFNATTNPNHQTAGFPTDCEVCHSGSSPTWEGATFAHSIYPLVGSHTSLDCNACHSSGVYQGLPSECVDCHIDDFNATTNPNHQTAGFPTDCEVCHSGSSPTWEGATFAHSIYPLVGSHTSLDCNACHSSGVYQGLPSECVDCHIDDFNATTNPNHQTAGFPTDCEVCHSGSSPTWEGATFAHSIYPLVGSHTSLDCNACHSSGVYQGLPSECVDCHIDDFNATTNPNHQTAGFPTDCEVCHSGSSPTWEGATFAHSIYPLVGSHASLDCNACHSSGVYQGLPSECVDCHIDDFNATTNPNHQTAGFPTDCEVCHSGSSPTWEGATFAHSIYPLVGSHTSLDCNACHSSGVYQGLPSECVDCHLDDYQATTNPNHQAAGFPTDCEVCHRATDISWNQGVFDHVWFPIDSGAHKEFECVECHRSAGSYAVFTCTTSCHPRGRTDQNHSEVAGYTYNSLNCLSCHPDGKSIFGPGPVSSHAVTR